ncbi:MAG: amidohydrolase family protein [Nitrospirota bacterium]|nr:amidohydrolase family protein [Nitrospirota bacterium]
MNIHGFVDLHTHGIGRCDTRTDDYGDILTLARLHAKAGTIAILPTIYSGPIDEMRKSLKAVSKAMDVQARGEGLKAKGQTFGAEILGVNLEGPFLNPVRCGAMDKDTFIKPTMAALKKLIAGHEEIVKIITIAPELPGALKVIEKCADMGIRVTMGHSDATLMQAVEAKKAGATGITHIFNAMRPFHHREPGLAGLGLTDNDLYIEVIADSVHLHPKILELIFNCKRLDRIIIVSDSVKGKKTAKGVVYDMGVLAGSGLTINGAVKGLQRIGIPDAEIIKASTDNPLRYLGIKKSLLCC